MAKVADRYFKVEPWKVIEEGFNPDYAMVGESIFSLGNEYMGVRGYFEEGYGGETLLGSYFNGVYEKRTIPGQGYKGIIHETEFMVNSVDWLYLRIMAGNESLDLANVSIEDFHREIDLRTGLLTREFLWKTGNGKLRIRLERLLSMVHMEYAVQRVVVTSVDYEGSVAVLAGLDFDTLHVNEHLRLWDVKEKKIQENSCLICGESQNTHMSVESRCVFRGGFTEGKKEERIEDKTVAILYQMDFHKDDCRTLDKLICNITPMVDEDRREMAIKSLEKYSYQRLLDENTVWWEKTWEKSDISIEGDEENQQGIRYCIFQMYQTYHGAVPGANIGAKGLTGEAYNGNAFWDTETYCLPFFLFHNKEAARNLLYFRYATLEEAKKRARELDCNGAFYPIATISGRECCNLWQHASLQLQASTAVAYGIWVYEKLMDDMDFLADYGLEMLIEISRMLASRGAYSAKNGHFGFYGVMGPDEFQMMVNHNCYTNFMGRFTFQYTLEAVEQVKKYSPEKYALAVKKVGLNAEELQDFKEKAERMYIPYDEENEIYEQHQGFSDLPHIDIDAIPVEEFPLYSHWTYDRIYRNDMIKQPDVLMFLLLFNSSFDKETLKRNYEYYEPKCIHESSLSPSVHSILASQLGKKKESYEFFQFATRMDLDNYNRNSSEGIHTTSIAAAWMNIVYGFGGLRSDGDGITLAPTIPEKWNKYRFRIVYKNTILEVQVEKKEVCIRCLKGEKITLQIYGNEIEVTEKEQRITIPTEFQ